MDPVSIVGLVAAALQLSGTCVTVTQSLNEVSNKFHEASRTLNSIQNYCKTIEIAINQIREWIENTLCRTPSASDTITGLQSAIEDYINPLNDLQNDVDKLFRRKGKKSTMGFRQKAQYVWNENQMQDHLKQLQYLASSLHLLLSTTQLSVGQFQAVVQEMSSTSDADSTASMRALLNYPTHQDSNLRTAEFVFQEVLLSTKLYQRAEAYANASYQLDDMYMQATDNLPDSIFPIIIVPRRENENFYGRGEYLDILHKKLQYPTAHSSNSIQICTLHGIGGVGKTQLALQYLYTVREYYDAIFWISAEDNTSISMSLSNASHQLGFDNTTSTPEVHVECVRKWLEATPRKWLLVFDNAEHVENIFKYIPNKTGGSGSIIITTTESVRESEFPPNFESTTLRVESFSSEEGTAFLSGLISPGLENEQEEKIALGAISERLGGSPFALARVAGYIKSAGITPSSCVDLINRNHVNHKTAHTYKTHSSIIFDQALRSLSNDARDTLNVLAFFDPDKIQDDLFTWRGFNSRKADITEAYFPTIIKQLETRGLAKRTISSSPYISMHRAIQLYVKNQLTQDIESGTAAFRQVVEILRRKFPTIAESRSLSKDDLLAYEEYFPHIESLLFGYHQLGNGLAPSLGFTTLLLDSGACMVKAGHFNIVQNILEVAKSGLEKLGEADNKTAIEDTSKLLKIIEEEAPSGEEN